MPDFLQSLKLLAEAFAIVAVVAGSLALLFRPHEHSPRTPRPPVVPTWNGWAMAVGLFLFMIVPGMMMLMLAHRVIPQVMTEAASTTKIDPNRLSFVNTLRVIESHLPEAPSRPPAEWYARLLREVSRQELRPRRNRIYPRVVKRTMKK